MGWRIVKQPNGLFASFSDIVDDFVEMNMNEDEAVDYCREFHDLSELEAREKVNRGIKDLKPYSTKEGSGTDRWN